MAKPVLVDLDFGGSSKATGLPTPTLASDAANKAYVDASGGGGGTTGGIAVLNFGTGTGSDVATIVITGQTSILTGSRVRVWFMAATTADHNADEHGLIFPSRVGLSAGNIVAGVGFTIYAETELQLTGNVSVCWEWS